MPRSGAQVRCLHRLPLAVGGCVHLFGEVLCRTLLTLRPASRAKPPSGILAPSLRCNQEAAAKETTCRCSYALRSPRRLCLCWNPSEYPPIAIGTESPVGLSRVCMGWNRQPNSTTPARTCRRLNALDDLPRNRNPSHSLPERTQASLPKGAAPVSGVQPIAPKSEQIIQGLATIPHWLSYAHR